MPDLITLRHVSYARPGGALVLRGLDWTIRNGQTWAVVGPVGSGKTTLAELLLGRLRPTSGAIEWPFVARLPDPPAWPAQVIEYVSFRAESRLFAHSRHYYQERFNFSDPLDDPTLEQFLRAGVAADDAAIRTTTAALGIESLRALPLIKLSNGQMRRARVARALLARPELLILDDPFLGLDAAGRADVARVLGELVCRGQRLILITRADLVPGWVTDVLALGATCRRTEPRERPGCAPTTRPLTRLGSPEPATDPVIDLRHVTVAYGERVILDDVSWSVRRGERWAVLGPNGSGKSTLLSLLCGDHPQAYSNDVRLFGRRRGSGESIWDVKARVGLVSPELHLYFHEPLTAAQAVATGYFDVMALRPTTAEQDARVRDLFAHFGAADLAARPFAGLSTGQQRLALFLRALVKRPDLLILDEPFQSFDATLAARLRDWLDRHLDPAQTLLFVTHHAEEVPRSVTHTLRLDGRVVSGV